MSRSTSLIALFGAAVLVVAVGVAVLRGVDGSDASDDPTVASTAADTPTEVATTDDPTSPAPTTPAPTTPSATDTPTDGAPTGDATAPDTGTDGTAGPDDDGGVEGQGTTDGDDTAGADTDHDEDDDADEDDDGDGEGGVAMGPTGDVQDTPNTGGGAVAALGALVAAGAVATGRRRHG